MRLRHLELTPNFALRVAVQVRGSSPCALDVILLRNTCKHAARWRPAAHINKLADRTTKQQKHNMMCWLVVLRQEWAAANSVALPVRDQRANTTLYYRFEEEVPTNILQVHIRCSSVLLTTLL